ADGPAAVRAAAGPWRNRASRAVREVADHLGDERRDNWTGVQRSADDLRFLLGRCDPLAAAVALRAGAGRGRTVRELSPDGLPTPAAWAVLARRCLDEVTVALIAGWPMSLRRVVGFAPDRAEPDAEVTDRLAVYHEALRPV